MNKPIIAIFVAGNLATKEEEQLIDKYMRYPHIILNAETFSKQESVIVDAVCGQVPSHLKDLPDPDTVIAKYEQYLAGAGKDVGGNPPTPPENGEKGDNGDTPPPPPPPTQTGFGNPPTPPENGEKGDNGDTPPPPPPPTQTGFGNPPTPPANNKNK